MSYAVTLAFLFIVWCVARNEARVDEFHIRHGRSIDHQQQWVERAAIVAFLACLTMIWLKVWALLLLPAGAFAFSATFRYRLNELRGLHPYYMSFTNLYDSVYLRISAHHGGLIAYITEITIAAAAVALLILNA